MDMHRTVAPDGGPISHAAPQYVPLATRVIRLKAEPNVVMSINAREFDPNLHEDVKPAEATGKKRERLPKAERSAQTRDELLIMTIDALKKLPEWEEISDMKLTKKAEIVDAILEARNED